MTDLVERLRARASYAEGENQFGLEDDLREAANEIERLRAEQGGIALAAEQHGRVAERKLLEAEIYRLHSELEGKISQSYATELARQVGELETENEQLRKEVALAGEPTCPHGLPLSKNCKECGDDD